MWSASSSTVTSTPPRSQAPWLIRSSSRPGQAIEDVDAGAQGLDLRVLADAAEDGAGAQAGGRGERREGRVDLGDQLAGRGEDQRARALRRTAGAGGVQPGDDRQQERVGLAGAGAAAAEHVASGEGVGQRRCLDGGGGGDAGAASTSTRSAGTPSSVTEC